MIRELVLTIKRMFLKLARALFGETDIVSRMNACHGIVEDAVWRPLTNLMWSLGHSSFQRFVYWNISNSAGGLQAHLYGVAKDDPDHPALKDFLLERCSHDPF